MTIADLERVLWRLRAMKPEVKNPSVKHLQVAIMKEIGTDPRTYTRIKKQLVTLGWIRSKGKRYLTLTNKDLEES